MKRVPRYRELAQQLQASILEGRHPIGSVLPGELELVTRHRVSRHTVREALRCLEEQGLIRRGRGVGTVVTADRPESTHVQHLGSPGEWMRYPEGSKLEVIDTAVISADAALAATLQARRGSRWHKVSTLRRLADGVTVIGWSDIYLPPRHAALVEAVGRRRGMLYEALEQRYGTRVDEVTVEIHAGLVPASRALQLVVPVGSPSLRVTRRYRDAAGRLLFVTFAEHPAERFTYAFELSRGAAGGWREH
jgi:DNA-binding GntR family transcriptional regulator